MNIKDLLPLLEYMHSLSQRRQRKFIEKANSKVIKAISDLAYNINQGNIAITEPQLKKLKKFRKEIKLLSLKKLSLKKRKSIIQTGRGNLPHALLKIAVPFLLNLFSSDKEDV